MRSIVALCHGLGLQVVAEGVERGAQLEFLASCGPIGVQGYLLPTRWRRPPRRGTGGQRACPASLEAAPQLPRRESSETLVFVGGAAAGARPPSRARAPRRRPRKARAPSVLLDFPVPFTEQDIYHFREGTYVRAYEKLGAHLTPAATHFAVWAPNATAVSLIGDFNAWGGRHPLRPRADSSGIWEGAFPESAPEPSTSTA